MKSFTLISTTLLCATLRLFAQTATPSTSVVPRLVSFSGIVKGATGKPISGQVAITFSLYSEQQGGSPLWSELQTVQPDNEGHYSVFLGAANANGLPLDLFTTGTARWLAVRPEVPGLEDPSRILLVGVPYALKAADADTLGGKPASAYVTSESTAVVSQAAVAPALTGVTSNGNPTGTGTTNYIPIWTSSTALGNSMLYQSGTNLGIGTATPAYPLSLSSTGNTFAPGVSYLAQFVGSGNGNSAGTTNYRGLDFEISATGSTAVQGFTSITGDNINSLSSAVLGGQSIFSANLRVNNSGSTTSGFGFQAIPILTGKGGITAWEAFDARTPSVSTAGGTIANSYGVYLEPQQVTGVTTGYGVYQAGTSDTNYLAGNLGIGTKTPGANLEVSGTAKFDGTVTFGGNVSGNLSTSGELVSTVAQGTAPLQVTSTTQVANLNASYLGGLAPSAFALLGAANNFAGTQSITGGLNLTGSVNSSLLLQPSVTQGSFTGANIIAGYNAGTSSGNNVSTGVTGATISGGGYCKQEAAVLLSCAVTARFGTVDGGTANSAGYSAVVSGGDGNTASGGDASVMGGYVNTASGQFATVAGGYANTASGTNSFAAGTQSNATDDGSFVWCQTATTCNSAGANSFVVSVNGPIYFYDGTGGSGCYLSSGSGSWTCSSDRNLKDNIQTIDPQSVLETLARMPISQWSMKADTKSNKHIGPMAQDFYAAFGLGETNKYIAQGDAQGVALASIQGLYELVKQKDQKIQSLEDRLQALEKLLLKK